MLGARIETKRLVLIALTDTALDSHHLQWFHENWSDKKIHAWSLHGPTSTLEESQEWMQHHMKEFDAWTYAVFQKPDVNNPAPFHLDVQVGNVNLRLQRSGPTLQPPVSFDVSKESSNSASGNESASQSIEHPIRVIGYSFHEKAHGRGYATEAAQALLDAYRKHVAELRADPDFDERKEIFYIEAGVDPSNMASIRVLTKLGYKKVGRKETNEPVFLNGSWRSGYLIYGQYF